MKKHLLAGFILLACPALVFSNNTSTFYKIKKEVIINDTLPPTKEIETEDFSKKTNNISGDKATKLYNNLGYLSSADQFLKKEGKGNLTSDDKARLANSYRLNSMTEDAEYWYAQFVNQESNSKDILHYAEMLQSNGKCEDAVRWYQVYSSKSDDKNRSTIDDCDALKLIPEFQGVEVVNVENLNTASLDFSPIMYQDGIVFSSTRSSAKKVRRKDKWTKEKFSDMFFSKKENEEFSKPQPLNGINEKFHDGTATFNQQGDYVIFTRNSNKGKSKAGVKELKLYEAKKENGKWSNIKPLNINNNEFATCHPTLSIDGKRLYFSSNRPGGFGEMDIYVSHKISGKWTEPKNLGPTVNSSGNEIFPIVHDDEKLYFSSNGHVGLGGLDIFVAEKTDEADETTWSSRQNLGKPFNSQKDDMGFVMEEENKSGYLASNRKGGKGKDDIYRWTMSENVVAKMEKKKMEQDLCVYNIKTNERLQGVNVGILPLNQNTPKSDLALTLKPSSQNSDEFVLGIKKQEDDYATSKIATSDKNGKFQYLMESNQDYYLVLSKKGYGTVQHQTDLQSVLKRDEYCIAMAPRSCVMMKGVVKNKDYNRPIPFAEVDLFNRCTGEKSATRADENGKFEFCVDCDCEFEIMANKDRFKESEIVFSTINKECSDDKMEEAVVELVLLDRATYEANSTTSNSISQPSYARPWSQQPAYGTNPTYSNSASHVVENTSSHAPMNPDDYVTKEYLKEYFTGNANHTFTVGETFTLKNIYYDFDKFNIRSDASIELDHLVKLMRLQPALEISLASHTDSRGADKYNQWLSDERAKSAKSYLISKGISSNRIHGANGMGETQPISQCQNCNEEEHQMNRRTEITITKI